ncbi:DEAD/DEAH box helicase [Saccharomonospora iraqiensis]|uniref:DEAD/DEAH box helicase n=1 Tax=Saccharomonospora iraqiensis TaxID=52698 RepID=UPI00022E074C|nr:SNF2-related protein [Saccharomonospora iraqiensis]
MGGEATAPDDPFAPPGQASTGPAGTTKAGPAAKAVFDDVRTFVRQATALLSAPDVLRRNTHRQIDILRDRQARDALSTRPVGELRALLGKGVRLGALEDAGYRTVAEILGTTPARLRTVPGIGPQSAEQVSSAAQWLADELRRETRIRLDPDRQEPGQTQLLALLAAVRHADSARASLSAPLKRFKRETTQLVRQAEPAGSRVGLFFRGRATKRTALDALARLDALLADPETHSLRDTVRAQREAANPKSYSPGYLWREYADDAASVNALLSTLTGQGDADETEAAQGFLPEELRQEITAVPLDTSLLTATLRGYQVFGAQYALHREFSILGDEMGLGKTVQALAAVAHLAANGQTRFLVVCPASVQNNWINEIRRHTTLTPHSLHGAERDAATRHWRRTGGIAVTTFGTLGRLGGVTDDGLAMVIVDEAHYVKNPESKRSRTAAGVVDRAQRALFLTGTPMENRVEEFRTLVGYLQPRIARSLDASDAVAGAKHFRRAVAPVYLRRNQEDVLTELPDKIELEDWVQFSPGDGAAYEATVRERSLMAMRQAAFHATDSAKLERLDEIVDEAREDGLKVVVFSNFLAVLETLEKRLGKVVVGRLTGSVPPAARQRLVDTFTARDGHAVLLSQIEAGGVGLNVQAASVVVLTEPQWKPSTEEQAIARAFRMGQIRKVRVHRLLAKGSVDERLREVQERKSLLFDEFARRSEAKEADRRAVDTSEHRPGMLDDEDIPLKQRIVLAERHRLGLDG